MDSAASGTLIPLPVQYDGAIWPLWQQPNQREPLAKDLDAGRWLEFGRPRDIRPLIKRYAADLGPLLRPDLRDTVSRKSRGRQENPYYLTEEQVLFLAAKSETPKATQVLKTLIAVFLERRTV